MKILAIDRSTDTQSVALALDGKVHAKVFAGLDARASDWPVKIRDFLAAHDVGVRDLNQVLVGQGPGSFAGIRAALAFAQGIALGNPSCSVVGLPSTYALTRDRAGHRARQPVLFRRGPAQHLRAHARRRAHGRGG